MLNLFQHLLVPVCIIRDPETEGPVLKLVQDHSGSIQDDGQS